MAQITFQTFLVPKTDREPDECQDSIYPLPSDSASHGDQAANGVNLFAVSDGVATSLYPREWARQLTTHFRDASEQAFEDWAEWIKQPQKQWLDEVRKLSQSPDASIYTRNRFYANEKSDATFIGLVVTPKAPNEWTWKAVLLGDSCLFRLRANEPLNSSPITEAKEFSFETASVASYPMEIPDQLTVLPRDLEPDCKDQVIAKEGDIILLATDAFSKWLLMRYEKGSPVWGSIVALSTQEDFKQLVQQARREKECPLHDDDVVLAVIKFGSPDPTFHNYKFEPNPDDTPPEGPPSSSTLKAAPQRSQLNKAVTAAVPPSPPLALMDPDGPTESSPKSPLAAAVSPAPPINWEEKSRWWENKAREWKDTSSSWQEYAGYLSMAALVLMALVALETFALVYLLFFFNPREDQGSRSDFSAAPDRPVYSTNNEPSTEPHETSDP